MDQSSAKTVLSCLWRATNFSLSRHGSYVYCFLCSVQGGSGGVMGTLSALSSLLCVSWAPLSHISPPHRMLGYCLQIAFASFIWLNQKGLWGIGEKRLTKKRIMTLFLFFFSPQSYSDFFFLNMLLVKAAGACDPPCSYRWGSGSSILYCCLLYYCCISFCLQSWLTICHSFRLMGRVDMTSVFSQQPVRLFVWFPLSSVGCRDGYGTSSSRCDTLLVVVLMFNRMEIFLCVS